MTDRQTGPDQTASLLPPRCFRFSGSKRPTSSSRGDDWARRAGADGHGGLRAWRERAREEGENQS